MTGGGAPEFSRVVRLDRIGRSESMVSLAADEGERAALAKRFGLLTLDRLEADYILTQEDGALVARGRLRADAAQPCVASGEPVPERIDAPFAVRFLPESAEPQEDEIALDADDCDTVFYSGESIDIGEAVAETLSLSLDPYPRAPGADAYLRERGVMTEEQAGPFAALLALQEKAAKRQS
ncbi:MAG: hypothetical protein DI547_15500 [Sphingobium sp.]|nr:MAG: hypothetical protein DI547_15500 [Sphingobium sp.]